MFKKIKENKTLQKIVEIWKTPRYRSLVILGLYVIFFTFVIIYIRSLNRNIKIEKPELSALESYEKSDNYYYYLSTNQKEISMKGYRYQKKQLIEYDGKNYYLEDGIVYQKEWNEYQKIEAPITEYELEKFDTQWITKLIKKGTLEYETNYQETGIKAKNYKIKREELLKLLKKEEKDTSASISITTYEKNNIITKVELDLTSYIESDETFLVTIAYDMYGKINPIQITKKEDKNVTNIR